jgi:DNA-binding IclR family transcriptional regulator
MAMAGGSQQHGQSVASKLVCILEVFSAERRRLRASDVCRRSGLPFSTVHRLLAELVSHGVLHHSADGTYAVGIRLWEIAALNPEITSLRALALPHMCDLYLTLRASVHLNVPVGDDGLCVEELYGIQDDPNHHQFGIRFPQHATAGGQVLFTYARPGPRQQRQFVEIRRAGLAINRNDTHLNIAAPIFDRAGAILASLEILAPLPADPGHLIAAVRSASRQVSAVAARIPRPLAPQRRPGQRTHFNVPRDRSLPIRSTSD